MYNAILSGFLNLSGDPKFWTKVVHNDALGLYMDCPSIKWSVVVQPHTVILNTNH